MIILSSCIEEYDPIIQAEDENKIVVMGTLTDDTDLHRISISRTSNIENPEIKPVTGCSVKIIDDNGTEHIGQDAGDGLYLVSLNLNVSGTSYMIDIITPEGDKIISDYETLVSGPEVDSIYFERNDLEGPIAGDSTKGIQFYLDLNASDSPARFYRWEVTETWEYHADYPLIWYYDGTPHQIWPPDYSRQVCWSTRAIPQIFTLTTNNLTENRYQKLPLHYVNNRSSRLMYGYSLLVKQHTLSEAAYTFWEQMRINNEEQGGLYEKQPLAIRGNLLNQTNPENEVLGFFGVSSVKTKRIFVGNIPSLPLYFSSFCSPRALQRGGFLEIDPLDYPAYLLGDEFTYYMVVLNEECVNCLSIGGTNVKPDFWPN